jgi:hypothetical protein
MKTKFVTLLTILTTLTAIPVSAQKPTIVVTAPVNAQEAKEANPSPQSPGQATTLSPLDVLNKAKTQAFYSPEVQNLVTQRAEWKTITEAVDKKAQEISPKAFATMQSPFERLSEDERNLYRKAQETASKSPEIKTLREAMGALSQSMEVITEALTPGYKQIKDKMQRPPQS